MQDYSAKCSAKCSVKDIFTCVKIMHKTVVANVALKTHSYACEDCILQYCSAKCNVKDIFICMLKLHNESGFDIAVSSTPTPEEFLRKSQVNRW